MNFWKEWHPHVRRIVALKIAVAGGMVVAHFFPIEHMPLFINLVWLFLF